MKSGKKRRRSGSLELGFDTLTGERSGPDGVNQSMDASCLEFFRPSIGENGWSYYVTGMSIEGDMCRCLGSSR